MARGPKKHLKRLNAPKHWMLDKLGGKFAPRPSTGPHKLRECLPLTLLLRNRLGYALNGGEVKTILMARQVQVDGKVRTDPTFPIGFMDVVEIEKSGDMFRLLYDTKGRFYLTRIPAAETKFKLCRVKDVSLGIKGIPFLTTHDGRTIRYPDPMIKAHDTVKVDLKTGKIIGFVKYEVGHLAMVTGGHNMGRVGHITRKEKHPGSFDIVHVQDSVGHTFSTRFMNIFVVGEQKAWCTLPKGEGVKKSVFEARDIKLAKGQ